MADGVIFEKLGIPTVSIITDSFTMSGNAMAKRQGMPGYRYTMVPHPIANLTPEQCQERAAAILDEVLDLLGLEARHPTGGSAAEQVEWPHVPWRAS